MPKTREELQDIADMVNEDPALLEGLSKLLGRKVTKLLPFHDMAKELGLSQEDMDELNRIGNTALKEALKRPLGSSSKH